MYVCMYMMIYNELTAMWAEAVVAYLKTLIQQR